MKGNECLSKTVNSDLLRELLGIYEYVRVVQTNSGYNFIFFNHEIIGEEQSIGVFVAKTNEIRITIDDKNNVIVRGIYFDKKIEGLRDVYLILINKPILITVR